jgi:hypothetical protein
MTRTPMTVVLAMAFTAWLPGSAFAQGVKVESDLFAGWRRGRLGRPR